MSVEHGGGSTEDPRPADPLRDSGLHVFAHLYEAYAASLFDYCDGLLQDTLAAADILRTRNPPSLALTPELGKQVARHMASCADCALSRGDRAFTADQLTDIPLVIPPGRLRLRITRTALALGSYRRTIAGRADKPDKPDKIDKTGRPGGNGQGSRPVQLRSRRGVPKAMAVSSVTLAVLLVPGALLYRLASAPPADPRPAVTTATSASPTPSPSPSPTEVSTPVTVPGGASSSIRRHHRHHHRVPPLPGATQFGELPAPLPAQGTS